MSEEMNCPICNEELSTGVITKLGGRGSDTFNNASAQRNDTLKLNPGTKVHRRCNQQYINKKSVAAAAQKRHRENEPTLSLRSTSSFDVKHECLFCGQYLFKRTKKQIEVFPVRTEKQFLLSIKEKCNVRKDLWSQRVLGRLEYCQDLHALEVKYHQQCSVNFRTGRDLPSTFVSSEDDYKSATRGRPVSQESKEAFEHIVSYLERKEDETLTVQHLVKEMENFGLDVFTPAYLKKKLIDHYGDTLFFTERDGLSDVVTLRENASKILFSFHHTEECTSEEAEKKKIIATAARLIKSDIKSITCSKSHYPQSSSISSCEENNEFLPESLSLFLRNLFSPLENSLTMASLGQALMQATRPKSLLAPLQIGLGIQIYHQTGSRQIVDTLHKLGLCSSYSEIRTFQKSAAIECGTDFDDTSERTLLQFVSDNIDHNIETIDGLNTFHGMGMIAVHTPALQRKRTIQRREISIDEVRELAAVKIIFCDSKSKPVPLVYKALSIPAIDNPLADADLLWRTSWIFHPQRPMWSGFMQTILRDEKCQDISTIEFLPIIDLKPTDESCILSTLLYLSNQAKMYNQTPVITFDQPLYWKAKTAVVTRNSDETLENIVLRLGGFHTAMSFLGCIGHVMGGSGIENVLEICYAANSIPYIMNGKAYSRAVRGHYLMDSALHALLMSDIYGLAVPSLEDNRDSESPGELCTQESTTRDDVSDLQIQCQDSEEIHALIEATMNRTVPVDHLKDDRHFQNITRQLQAKQEALKDHNTAKLWFTYLDMVGLLRCFIQAERTGNWKLHLSSLNQMLPYFAATGHNLYLKSAHVYLESMRELEMKHPDVHQAFLNGHHVVRRNRENFTGLSTDLTIEQTLMKSIKSTGGLTRGRGMDENQRALWIMSMPSCAEINEAITDLIGHVSTADCHKDMRQQRRFRDSRDISKLVAYLSDRNPFSGVKDLRNINTGQIADSTVSCHQARSVGEIIVSKMHQENVLTFTFRRKDQLINMSAKSSCVLKNKPILVDPRLLFQRLSTVADIMMEEGENAMRYELCSFPPALFDCSGLPLEARKPAMRDALCALCKESAETTEIPHEQFKYVLDGGSLLHRLPWTRGKPINVIIHEYCTYVTSKFGSCHIVFDGYSDDPSTKDVTHMRRNVSGGVRIIFDLNSFLQTSKDMFLSNILNRRDFVFLLGKALEQSGQSVKHAKQDADRDIVMTAVEVSEQNNVVVIGEDTDLLCLLCAHFQNKNHDIYLTSTRQPQRVYCIRNIQRSLGDNTLRLLFSHALLGCDTTSRLFGIGKATALRKLQDNDFQMLADVFLNSSAQKQDIIKAGERALLAMYGAGSLESLDVARKQRFAEKIAKSAVYVEPQTLPPTTAAAKFHSLRVYHQVQEWLGTTLSKQMDPTNWGFHIQKGRLVPIMTDLPPAPERLLAVVTCACKTGCSTVRCTCRKHGLKCTSACSGCHGSMCCNDVALRETVLEDDNDDID